MKERPPVGGCRSTITPYSYLAARLISKQWWMKDEAWTTKPDCLEFWHVYEWMWDLCSSRERRRLPGHIPKSHNVIFNTSWAQNNCLLNLVYNTITTPQLTTYWSDQAHVWNNGKNGGLVRGYVEEDAHFLSSIQHIYSISVENVLIYERLPFRLPGHPALYRCGSVDD